MVACPDWAIFEKLRATNFVAKVTQIFGKLFVLLNRKNNCAYFFGNFVEIGLLQILISGHMP